MTIHEPPHDDSFGRAGAAKLLRVAMAGLLGALTAMLVSCGSSGAGLIPAGNAGPLQRDFEEIAAAAQSGNGSCSATEAAIQKTEQDFRSLPGNVDNGLRNTLRQGIANLRGRALVACTQPLPQATVTTSTTKTTTPTTSTPAPTTSTTTPTTTTPPTTTTTPPTTTGPQGGTPAPNGEPSQGGQGGTEPPGSGGAGAGGQEGGK
jgi:hypothetical protein